MSAAHEVSAIVAKEVIQGAAAVERLATLQLELVVGRTRGPGGGNRGGDDPIVRGSGGQGGGDHGDGGSAYGRGGNGGDDGPIVEGSGSQGSGCHGNGSGRDSYGGGGGLIVGGSESHGGGCRGDDVAHMTTVVTAVLAKTAAVTVRLSEVAEAKAP